MERIVVIGGNAAGMSAAARAKRLRPDLVVTVLETSGHVSYSICGTPYYIGGQVQEAADLVSFTPEAFLEKRGATVLIHTEAVAVQPGMKKVQIRDRNTGHRGVVAYDRLVIATGYVPLWPSIEGLSHPRVFTLSRLEEAMAIRRLVDRGELGEVLIVGGGYVGLELCEALRARKCRITLVERGTRIFGNLDDDMSEIVAREVRSRGIDLRFGSYPGEFRDAGDKKVEALLLPHDEWRVFDAVLVDIGVGPNVQLAREAGIQLGRSGAIAVSDRMETSVSSIYAAGNCAETIHLVSGQPVANFLGTAANKQGRVVGDNLAGRVSRFSGILGTSVVKVFALGVGSTGLNTQQARDSGFRVEAVRISAPATARYFPGSANVTIKVLFDRQTTRLLGAQVIGTQGVAKRVDVMAVCLTESMKVDDAAQLDLGYSPPYAQVWDPIHVAMHAAQRVLYGK